MNALVPVLVIVVVLLVAAVVVIAVLLTRNSRSRHLKQHFGDEYERSVSQTGDRKAAEHELAERERRRRQVDVRALEPAERQRFQESWTSVQRAFVDDPQRALHDADALVVEIMRTRGYPVDDFDRRADDISVDHPDVVQHYRDARQVHDASAGGAVDTERQRHAVTSYRALVESLLDDAGGTGPTAPRSGRPDATRNATDHGARRSPSEEQNR